MDCGAMGGSRMQSAVRESSGPDAGVPSGPHGQEKHGAQDRGGLVDGGFASLCAAGAREPARHGRAGHGGEAWEAQHRLMSVAAGRVPRSADGMGLMPHCCGDVQQLCYFLWISPVNIDLSL